MKTYAFRLKPKQNLREEIDAYVTSHAIRAGVILSSVGNLEKAVLRMADASVTKTYEGTFEIVSMTGTVGIGKSHLHMSISDIQGIVHGGHLQFGSVVGITAEIVIGELEGIEFGREYNKDTGFDELTIKNAV